MKVKAAFSKIIQPELVQYMIEKYGNSYDTFESVRNSWRLTYPVSDEIIEEIFLQIKTIEKINLEEYEYKRETYQSSLTEIIADHLYKYVRRSPTKKYIPRGDLIEFIRENIDISENKAKKAQYIIKRVTSNYVYICDVSKTEVNVACEVQEVLWHIYKHHKLEDRRLFYRDTFEKIIEIVHENGIFKGFADNHFQDLDKRPRVGEKAKNNRQI